MYNNRIYYTEIQYSCFIWSITTHLQFETELKQRIVINIVHIFTDIGLNFVNWHDLDTIVHKKLA
jgi:hypothetical protein